MKCVNCEEDLDLVFSSRGRRQYCYECNRHTCSIRCGVEHVLTHHSQFILSMQREIAELRERVKELEDKDTLNVKRVYTSEICIKSED